jgi:hypothetical protein
MVFRYGSVGIFDLVSFRTVGGDRLAHMLFGAHACVDQ